VYSKFGIRLLYKCGPRNVLYKINLCLLDNSNNNNNNNVTLLFYFPLQTRRNRKLQVQWN
jgi:hypothetical protein